MICVGRIECVGGLRGMNLRQSFCRLQQTSESLLILVDFPMFGFRRGYCHPIQLLSEQKDFNSELIQTDKRSKNDFDDFDQFRGLFRLYRRKTKYLTRLILCISTDRIRMSHTCWGQS